MTNEAIEAIVQKATYNPGLFDDNLSKTSHLGYFQGMMVSSKLTKQAPKR